MTGCLYLLADKNAPHFKIGIAKNVGHRIGALSEDIDIGKSVYAECSKRVKSVETALHLMFDEYRVKDRPQSDGYTEWFSGECFGAVKQFIEDNGDRLGVTELRPVSDARSAGPRDETRERSGLSGAEGWPEISESVVLSRLMEKSVSVAEFIRRTARFRIEASTYVALESVEFDEFKLQTMDGTLRWHGAKCIATVFNIDAARRSRDGAAMIDLSLPNCKRFMPYFGDFAAQAFLKCQRIIRSAVGSAAPVSSAAEIDAALGRRDGFYQECAEWFTGKLFFNFEDRP